MILDELNPETEYSDTLEHETEVKSSARVLAAIKKSHDAFREYHDTCARIDDIYNRDIASDGQWLDPEFDLFWASMEIVKPAVYAKAPQPAVSPMFADNTPLKNTTAELLERVTSAGFDDTNIDGVMLGVRDDLIFTNRGVMWATYEANEGQRICVEHLDRTDFGHEPARKWEDVGYVWRRAWMTRTEMRKRFRKTSGDAYQTAQFAIRREDKQNGSADDSKKAGVYEVWHKADNRVYWVTEGVPVMLDEGEPHLKLKGFYPCPKPAYGTLRRRSLVPIPDYVRYAPHLAQVNKLTARIYLLLDRVKLKGLIPAGGEVGDAVEQLMNSNDDEMLIPVPAAAFNSGGAGGFVSWLPIAEVATAIQGLIDARTQLFADFDNLSGISDIMRGDTEATETLGAQQLKSQYGSVRVRQKIEELQRIAADVARIMAEIAADKFSQDTLLDLSQMEIPTKSDIKKAVKDIEDDAEREMKALGEQAKKAAQQAQQQAQQSGQPPQPQELEQAQQQLVQAQQQLIAKYSDQLKKATDRVTIEEVFTLLRDDKARGFAFEIATDSTIMTDELQEKASRTEFMSAFTNAFAGLAQLTAMGKEGSALAGGFLKFVLAPYRVGRELNKMIDDFVDAAPEIAAQMAEQQGDGGESAEMAAATMKLAEAEIMKAQAQTAKVQSDSQLKQAELQGKMQEMQSKAAKDQQDAQLKVGQLQLTMSKQEQDFAAKIALTEAQINKLQADTAKILSSIGLDARKQDLEEYTAASDAQAQQVDQQLNMQNSERDAAFRADEAGRAHRGEERADRQQDFSERSGDRQMTLAEKQAQRERA